MKFKSIHIIPLLFFISCETSAVDTSVPTESVSFFVTQDDRSTKGRPIESADNLANIGVFAVLTQKPYAAVAPLEPNFMSNQLVEHIDDEWVYSPPREWSSVSDGRVSFFAYAPFANSANGLSVEEVSGAMPTLRYQVPQTTNQQPDLMVATPVYDRVKSQGTVALTLQHALAAVSFSVKGDPSRTISAVRISNIVSAATLSLDGSQIAWSNPAERSTETYTLGLSAGATSPAFGGVATPITAEDGYLMMIPQEITDVEIAVKVKGEKGLIALNFEPNSKWVAGAKYDYTINLETESIEPDITGTSNCYIVNNNAVSEVYIPVDQRINTFWRDYSGLDETESAKYMIGSDTEWGAKIVWCDNDALLIDDALLTDDAQAVKYNGFIPANCSSSRSFVCDDTQAVMKVTLPANTEVGNILIAVTKDIDGEEKILWSWHLWVTDYNPDSDVCKATREVEYDVEGGKLHRYTLGSDFWKTGRYSQTFAMDRDLGSHDNMSTGGLFYQWGRKDPFSEVKEWGIELNQATFATAVQNPTVFYAAEFGWCIEPEEPAYTKSNNLWYDIKLPNNTDNTFAKSIFDPSPLGWCMPLRGAYNDWGARDDYPGVVYFHLTGDVFPLTGEMNEVDYSTSLWCSDKAPKHEAYYPYITSDNLFTVKVITTAYGHRVRPVKIP